MIRATGGKVRVRFVFSEMNSERNKSQNSDFFLRVLDKKGNPPFSPSAALILFYRFQMFCET